MRDLGRPGGGRHGPWQTGHVERLTDGGHPHDLDARRRRRAPTAARWPAGSRAGPPRPAAGRLAHLAQLAAEPDLAAGHQVAGQRLAGLRRGDGERDAEVGPRLGAPSPRRRPPREHVAAPERQPSRVPFEHGEEQRQPAGVDALGRAPGQRRSCDGTTSACTSTSSGRWPSIAGTTTEPGDARRRSARNRPLAVGHAARPASAISNRPSSSVEPKRCLTARSRRRAWWRSPSKDSTVSTTCSSTRGPASAPSLVTWPTSTVVTPRALASAPGGGRTPAPGRPTRARRPARGRSTVWIESTTSTSGRTVVEVGEHVGQQRLGRQPQLGRQRAEALGPAAHLRAPTPRPRRRGTGRPAAGHGRQGLEQQRGLADAGLAAEQRDRAGHQAAAQHPVELADPVGVGRPARRRSPR